MAKGGSATAPSGDLRTRLAALARIARAPAPVVSVYLNTLWTDEHQRDRVRVFLADEIKRARAAGAAPELAADLDWIAAEGTALVQQTRYPDAHGVVLFACGALGLREVLPVRVPVEDLFVVADAPYLRRLVELVEDTPATLLVFVDGESARLVELRADGVGGEVTLESEVPGHHRQGGWQLLAQSRYQRHIQARRAQHFDAVAGAVTDLVDGSGVERIVVAGESRALALFQKHLEARIAKLVVGSIAGAKYEPSSAFVERAGALLGLRQGDVAASAVDAALTEAAKGGRAAAGLEPVLDAAVRGAVRRLYLLKTFREAGRHCAACGALQPGNAAVCRRCKAATKDVELGEALVQRVLTTGGSVETVETHAGLGRAGGVAALLRYPV
jgi:peptide subunit release factor 1 (eRF1)